RPVHGAPVVVDGYQLFQMRGSPSYPAHERAALVRANIIAAAANPAIAVTDLRTVEITGQTQIYAGELLLMGVLDLDGQFEGVDRAVLADRFTRRISQAITQYR